MQSGKGHDLNQWSTNIFIFQWFGTSETTQVHFLSVKG